MSNKMRLSYNLRCRRKRKQCRWRELSSAALATIFLGSHRMHDSLENLQLAWNQRLFQAGLSVETSLSRSQLVSAAVPEPSAQRSLSWSLCSFSEPVRKFQQWPLRLSLQNSRGLWDKGPVLGPSDSVFVFDLQGAHWELHSVCQGASHTCPGREGAGPPSSKCQTTAGNAASGICQEGPSTTTLGMGVGWGE